MTSIDSAYNFQNSADSYLKNSATCKKLSSTKISASNEQNKNVVIFTNEGDKVTLSYASQTQAHYADYDKLVYQKPDNFISVPTDLSSQFESNSSASFSILVDGDLNDQELEDINKAIKKIDKLMMNFLQDGDATNAINKGLEVCELDFISGIEAVYSYRETITVEHFLIDEQTNYSEQGLVEDAISMYNEKDNGISKLLNEMTEIIKDSGIQLEKFIKPIDKMFDNILEQIDLNDSVNSKINDIVNLIHNNLTNRINNSHVELFQS